MPAAAGAGPLLLACHDGAWRREPPVVYELPGRGWGVGQPCQWEGEAPVTHWIGLDALRHPCWSRAAYPFPSPEAALRAAALLAPQDSPDHLDGPDEPDSPEVAP